MVVAIVHLRGLGVPVKVVARCIVIKDSELLVQVSKKGDRYRLPGGSVNDTETIVECLKREMHEELGVNIEISKLLYIVESFYKKRNRIVHEIGFYFLCRLSSEKDENIMSREKHVEIYWCPLDQLEEAKFRPPILLTVIREDFEKGFRGPYPRYIVGLDLES
ncbi:MAG TPA: NUDIX domain-containing protein [Pyrodictium sp.]|nr:NUDIX domain-containing protein [Pyrodictium sp.]HIQ55558.1 NUDIX domain-containing protein [Pyrodictium sp.]